MIHESRVMHPNEINAAYMQYRNWGYYYIVQLSGPLITIDEWRERELQRYEKSNETH